MDQGGGGRRLEITGKTRGKKHFEWTENENMTCETYGVLPKQCLGGIYNIKCSYFK